jgi:hypothetical protein
MSRTAPPVHVLVDRFTVWTATVAVLWVFAACSVAAWFAEWSSSMNMDSGVRFFWIALGMLVPVLLAGLWLSRFNAVSLRWDGEQWWLGEPSDVGVEPWRIQPWVRLDLGVWMLLQLEPAGAGPRLPGRYRWLPLQRRGRATQWHGLRCALLVYPEHRRGPL